MSKVLGLVLHVQVGNGSLYGYFNNPASQVSAHFWCGADGSLEQYVDTSVVAWAEVAGNPNYLSVETEGYPTDPLTPAQLSKLAELLAWSASAYNFPMTGPTPHGQPGFSQHCNPDGTPDPAWGNHSCPDPIRMGQMADIIALTKPPPAPPSKEENETMTNWQSGGQDHVAGVIGNAGYHWWQNTPGTAPPNAPANYYEWHVELLPMP